MKPFACVLCLFACDMAGVCKVGVADDCPAGAFCYGGQNAKSGEKGVCTYGYGDHEKDDAPVIREFGPLAAAHGARLRIQGANFGKEASQNSVMLNGFPAAILLATESEIEVEVPKEMRCSGLIEVSVHDKTALSALPFTYLPTAIVSTFAGSGVANWLDGTGVEAGFNSPNAIAIDESGNLYVADTYNHRIRTISPEGQVRTLAGSGIAGFLDGQGSSARFNYPNGIALDAEGTVYVADYTNHRIRKILPTGEVSTFAGSGTAGANDAMGTDAQFQFPDGIVLGAEGNLYVADSRNNRIRTISPEGQVRTLAGGDTAGFADGQGSSARFNYPNGIALDAEGNLYVADSYNNRIRKISPEGEVRTLAGNGMEDFLDGPGTEARFNFPHGIAADNRTGNLYVLDGNNNRLRMVTPSAEVHTLAGGGATGSHVDGTGSAARFNFPHGIVLDAEGNLYVTDSDNHRIRKVVLE